MKTTITHAHDFDIFTRADGTTVLCFLDNEQTEYSLTISRREVQALLKKLTNKFLTILAQ